MTMIHLTTVDIIEMRILVMITISIIKIEEDIKSIKLDYGEMITIDYDNEKYKICK